MTRAGPGFRGLAGPGVGRSPRSPPNGTSWPPKKPSCTIAFCAAQAEFQNLRKRTERERLELFEYASMEAVRVLLPILDDFERAAQGRKLRIESTSAGIELIYNRFYEALKKLGLEPIDSQGQPFDPQIHHAVDMVETDEAPDHTVLEEFQRGYNLRAGCCGRRW